MAFAEKAVAATNRKEPAFLDTLAAAYAEAGQFDKAVIVQREGMDQLKDQTQKEDFASRLKLYVAKRPYREPGFDACLADMSELLAVSQLKQEKSTAAEPLARACLALREKESPDDWRTFNSRSVLGGSLLGQKKYAQAEPFLLAGYEGMKKREGQSPAGTKLRLKETVQRLVQLYEATGRQDKAAEWKQKLEAFSQPAPATNSAVEPKPR